MVLRYKEKDGKKWKMCQICVRKLRLVEDLNLFKHCARTGQNSWGNVEPWPWISDLLLLWSTSFHQLDVLLPLLLLTATCHDGNKLGCLLVLGWCAQRHLKGCPNRSIDIENMCQHVSTIVWHSIHTYTYSICHFLACLSESMFLRFHVTWRIIRISSCLRCLSSWRFSSSSFSCGRQLGLCEHRTWHLTPRMTTKITIVSWKTVFPSHFGGSIFSMFECDILRYRTQLTAAACTPAVPAVSSIAAAASKPANWTGESGSHGK